jgi:hypothetical protein
MCNIVSRGVEHRVTSADEAVSLLKELEKQGRDHALLFVRTKLYLAVIMNKRCIAIIYQDDSSSPELLDASVSAEPSPEKVSVSIEGTPTPIPKSMCLPKRTGIEVIRYFCKTGGELSPLVFWLREGVREKQRGT